MKKLIVILVPVIVVAAAFLLALLYSFSGSESEAPAGRIMSVESYVTQNISELSPMHAVLGGTYYVTDISATGGKGTVSYEDGHVAYTADFTYVVNEETGIAITSFTVRP